MIAFVENLAGTLPVSAPPAPTLSTGGADRSPRFTIDGDDGLERRLVRTCDQVLSGIRGLIPARKLEALLLGGGYGRGEGGVLRAAEGDQPYNDLEFYVAIAGNRHVNELRYQRRLQVLGEILTHLAGVEVEFKITSLAELARRPISMFSYDLVVGHRVLWSAQGATDLKDCDHHRRAEDIPAEEATRLLMNRCSGLLLARVRLARDPFAPAAADFVGRNIAKAQLAMGDAVLTAHGLYHWSCRERHARLQRLAASESTAWFAALLRHHAAGVEFKLHPPTAVASRDALIAQHGEVSAFALECWLRLEGRRLARRFPSARAYALDTSDKCADSPRWRNFVLNLRADGFSPRLHPRPWQHPRQRVFRALALLLWEPAALTEPVLRARLEQDLHARMSTFPKAVDAYERFWASVR